MHKYVFALFAGVYLKEGKLTTLDFEVKTRIPSKCENLWLGVHWLFSPDSSLYVRLS